MSDLSDRLGLINPVDFTRIFVHPASRDELTSRVTHMRDAFILIEGVRIKVVESLNMPLGKVFYGGQVLMLEDYPNDRGKLGNQGSDDPGRTPGSATQPEAVQP